MALELSSLEFSARLWPGPWALPFLGQQSVAQHRVGEAVSSQSLTGKYWVVLPCSGNLCLADTAVGRETQGLGPGCWEKLVRPHSSQQLRQVPQACRWLRQRRDVCLWSSVPVAGPGAWPLSQAQDALIPSLVAWVPPSTPAESVDSKGKGSQGSGATSWVRPVTQAAVALPAAVRPARCCGHRRRSVCWPR